MKFSNAPIGRPVQISHSWGAAFSVPKNPTISSIMYKLMCEFSEDSNQSSHSQSLISFNFMPEEMLDPGQPIEHLLKIRIRLSRLIWFFDGPTCQLCSRLFFRLAQILTRKPPRKICIWKDRLLKSSAANNCLALLKN